MSGKPIRRTQAITPFGPGALVDFPGPVSLIHAGIDAYPFNPNDPEQREFIISDETRLSQRLGVQYFVQPMDHRPRFRGQKAQENQELHLPFLKFPLWHMCPRCGMLHKSEYHLRDIPKCRGPIGSGKEKGKSHEPRTCIQVRFVVACEKGHLSDFPWLEWISSGQGAFETIPNEAWLRWRASGNASASGIEITAERLIDGEIRVVHKKTLGQIFGGPSQLSDGEGEQKALSPLGRMGIVCKGDNPVLATGTRQRPAEACGHQLYVLLRNASNLYFPQIKSSIFIPTLQDSQLDPEIRDITQDEVVFQDLRNNAINSDDGLVTKKGAKNILRDRYPHLESEANAIALQQAANEHLLLRFLETHTSTRTYVSQQQKSSETGQLTKEQIETCLKKLDWEIDPQRLIVDPDDKPPMPVFETQIEADDYEEDCYRLDEYLAFSQQTADSMPKTDLDVSIPNLNSYSDWFTQRFSKVGLLKKLRETRVFTGFSRVFSQGLTPSEQRALFCESTLPEWLPGVIVRGEGIFLEFDETALDTWYEKNSAYLQERETLLTLAKANSLKLAKSKITQVDARQVLIHTFSHLLINQLIYDCGYGSASLRERIYCSSLTEPRMNAFLIYTAAGDSEGSMGGLVRVGQSDKLGDIIEKAILKASWCSSDPICIESKGQGPSGQNLAACHACALLPETSCELMNLMLDRSMVVGTLEDPSIGFFSEVIS